MQITVDDRDFKALMQRIEREAVSSWNNTGSYFKKITPKDTGNARRNTRTKTKEILADYAYAGRLDEGWSKQAPNGMTDPAIEYFEKDLNFRLGKL